jgi:hypothetical protein
MFAQQLEGNDVPLSNAQVEKLQDAYVEERARVPPPEFSFTGDPTTYIESMGEWQKDYNRRVGDRVATILNAEQLSVYNEIRQWQDQMQGGVQFTSPVVGVTGMPAIGGANVVTFSAAAPAIAVSAPANEKED